jgi:hypothetical protein
MQFADACYICGIGEESEEDGNRMLVCDGCDWRTSHLACLGMTEVPDGEWLCSDCEGEPPLENPERPVHRSRRRRRRRLRRAPGEKRKRRYRRRKRGLVRTRTRRAGDNSDEEQPENDDEYEPSLHDGRDSESEEEGSDSENDQIIERIKHPRRCRLKISN